LPGLQAWTAEESFEPQEGQETLCRGPCQPPIQWVPMLISPGGEPPGSETGLSPCVTPPHGFIAWWRIVCR